MLHNVSNTGLQSRNREILHKRGNISTADCIGALAFKKRKMIPSFDEPITDIENLEIYLKNNGICSSMDKNEFSSFADICSHAQEPLPASTCNKCFLIIIDNGIYGMNWEKSRNSKGDCPKCDDDLSCIIIVF